MLVLKRKINESVFIGLGIKVTILAVEGSTVKIGIEAPDAVKIVREELLLEEKEHEEKNSVTHDR